MKTKDKPLLTIYKDRAIYDKSIKKHNSRCLILLSELIQDTLSCKKILQFYVTSERINNAKTKKLKDLNRITKEYVIGIEL